MKAYCTLHPNVKVGDTFEPSILFGDIKSYVFNDYNTAVSLYHSIKVHIENEGKGEKNLSLNSQSQVTLDWVLDNLEIQHFLGEKFYENLKNKFNLVDSSYSVDNYNDAVRKCEELNNSIYGKNYFATIEFNDKGDIIPKIKYKANKDSFKEERINQKRSNDLYSKMTSLLNKWGIAIDVLNEAEAATANDRVDFSSVEKAADGLYHIIRIAKGEKGLNALPEAFGHVIVRALENNPLMKRTINLVMQKGLAKDILGDNYEEYVKNYSGDEQSLAEEAVSKLMAIHFLQQEGIQSGQAYSSILGRTVSSAQDFFKKLNETEISDAINEVNENIVMIAKSTLNGDIDVKAFNIRLGGIMNQIDQSQNRTKNLQRAAQRIINNENKRLKIYKEESKSTRETLLKTKELVNLIRQGNIANAISLYIENSNKEVKSLLQEIKDTNNFSTTDYRQRAKWLRNCRNRVFSYLGVMQELSKDIGYELKFSDSALNESVSSLVRDTVGMLGDCMVEYNLLATELTKSFWGPIIGNEVVVDKGWFSKKPEKYTIDQILNMDVNDINWFDRWCDSMAQSSSYILKGMDKVVGEKKNNGRIRTIDFFKKISALTKELERNGVKNQDFMFEVDEKGNKTGFYVSKINRGKYYRERNNYIKGLEEKKYSPQEIQRLTYEWEDKHPIEKYPSKQFEELQKDKIKFEYWKKVVDLKTQLDSFLPPNKVNTFSTIKIRKDFLERLKSSKSLKDATDSFINSIKENFVRNSTDTEYGVAATITDFEGFEYRTLPVFYTHKTEDTSENDISTDIVSTMTAYAQMAYEHDEMSNIIDVLETTHSMIRTGKKPISTRGGKNEVEVIGASQQWKRKEVSLISERMNDFFDMQVYRMTKKDEGTVFGSNVDTGKAADELMKWNSSITMAFNILANISNVMTGNIQFKLEAVGGQFFNYSDALAADKIYTQHLKDFVKDLGSRTKSSWFWTVSEMFNVMQERDRDLKHKDFDKKWYEKMSINGLAMIGQQAGEIWMQHRTFFALMHSKKEALKDSNGNEVLAINSFEVVPINKSRPQDGSKLVFKKGLVTNKGERIVTKEELEARAARLSDPLPITSDKLLKEGEISEMQYINRMSKKSAELNHYIHGIYNEEDKAAMYSKSIGRLVGQYRKWIMPSLNRRFAKTTYNYNLESMTEGTYRTAARFLMQNFRDIKSMQFNIVSRWNELDDYEKANLRKVIAELATYSLIVLAIHLIPDDDDDYRMQSYTARMYKYQMYRLRNEIGALIPGFSMIKEGYKILNSPMAGVDTLEKVSDVFTSITPWNWKEIQSGRYKGWYKPWNTVVELLPYNKPIYRSLHPENSITYYK